MPSFAAHSANVVSLSTSTESMSLISSVFVVVSVSVEGIAAAGSAV